MRSFTKVLTFVFVNLLATNPAFTQVPQQPLSSYAQAYAQIDRDAAVLFAQENTRANIRTNQFTAWVDAQCKILNAKSAWITAITNASATNAKTLVTLQEVHSAKLDNNLKAAKTFYDKRALHAGYQGLSDKKRPTQGDVMRYSQASMSERPNKFQLCSLSGKINWPGVLLADDFLDARIRLNSLFVQRLSGSPNSAEDNTHEIQEIIAQMREQLRLNIREMSSSDYLATRKFLESLARESQLAPRIDGVASN
ncbi:MAG: hypothetical protein ABIH36_03565 [bacterium]